MEIKFDMYWAFSTGLGVLQDTLGTQNRLFLFGCKGREHMSKWYWEDWGFHLKHAS